jgi:26S proteasome regulatory subunit N7
MDTDKRIQELQKKMEEDVDNLDEKDKAHYIFEIAKIYKEKKMMDKAIEQFKETIAQTTSFNTKIDAIFEILHIGLMDKNQDIHKEYLNKCTELLKTEGGDWEKKNRLKVYEGLNFILNKNFKDAGKNFLDALMTFTSYELFDFKTFVFYTAITNIITVDRKTLKERIIDNSDVLSCINDIPHLQSFLNSFYDGDYFKFFEELYYIIEIIKKDFYLSKHYNFFINEMRIKVYSQFLQSYKTVTIENMANVFGVSTNFIDSELSNFISQGRLNAKIDKVSGIIECSHNEQNIDLYQTTIRESDILISKIHNLVNYWKYHEIFTQYIKKYLIHNNTILLKIKL